MIEHVVLFKWKTDSTPDSIASVVAGLRGLKDRVPGIVDLTCGENFSDRGQGYRTALVVRFVDRAALDAYGPHPAHQDVVTRLIVPIREDVIVADYEID